MPKQEGKKNSFPPLQKRIILYLSKHDPQDINQTRKGIKGQYKSSWLAFESLKKKGLIQRAAVKDYHKRKYPQYWLTERGIFIALYVGAEPQPLLEKALEIYPEDRDLHLLIESAPIVGKYALEVLYLAALTNGQMEEADVDFILARQMRKKLSPEATKQFIAVMKKYPEQYQRLKDTIEKVSKKVSELSDLLK